MSALAADERERASTPVAAPALVPDAAAAGEFCRDCGETLRDGDDALCRWCDDNRRLDPAWYEAPGAA
ncbi:hypothetical protein [Luteimicrobium album]|nr:hypothetical protein [Luteimicrobium album]